MLAALSLLTAVELGGCGSGSSSSSTTAATTGPARKAGGPPRSAATSEHVPPERESTPGASITEYGAAAGGARKAAVAAAVHSFFTAMATGNYEGLCAGLAASNREQLSSFVKGQGGPGSCAVALKKLLNPTVAGEAREAAAAPITSVRIEAGTAFALFKPRGGSASYFVMKEEGGKWKAISLAPGTSLDPGASP